MAQDAGASEQSAVEKPQAAANAAPAPVSIPSEDEINAPDRRTLVMLGVVFAVTVLCWGSARFACNMHPPESHGPPKLDTRQLSATPKDAAIEIQQRWSTKDYSAAKELAVGPAAEELGRAVKACEAKPADCVREREEAGGALTTAVVTHLDMNTAEATTTTYRDGKKEVYKYQLQREGATWFAASRTKAQ